MKRLLFLLIAAGGMSLCRAQDGDAPADEQAKHETNIRLTIQTYSLSLESLTELMESTGGKNPQIHQHTIALVAEEKAKLLDTIMVTSIVGELGNAGAYQEYIFPTEYDTPELQNSSGKDGNFYTGKIPDNSGIPYCLSPTAFETRYLGMDLSTSSAFHSKAGITSKFDVTIDELVRLNSHFKHSDNWGKIDMKMPVFDSWVTSDRWGPDRYVSLNLQPGTFTLFTTHRPSVAKATTFDDSRVLIFIRADIIAPEP